MKGFFINIMVYLWSGVFHLLNTPPTPSDVVGCTITADHYISIMKFIIPIHVEKPLAVTAI